MSTTTPPVVAPTPDLVGSVLLATDTIACYPPSQNTDSHGWRLPDLTDQYWTGAGALQLRAGVSDPMAADGGGHGPYDPAYDEVGDVYLPAEAGLTVLEGTSIECRGRWYVLSQVRLVADPAGLGLACWVATATSVDSWPGDT